MKLEFKFNSKEGGKMNLQSFVNLSGVNWKKSRTVFFFVLLLTAILSGGYIWRQSLSGAGWSQQRKQDFLDSQNKNIEFKQQAYQKVVNQISIRKDKNAEEYQPVKDIFVVY